MERKEKIKFKLNTDGAKTLIAEVWNGMKEIITRKRTITESNAVVKELYLFAEKTVKKSSIYTKNEKISFCAIGVILLHITILICGYVASMGRLRAAVLSNSPLYLLTASILPFVSWLYATNENFWAFYRRKRVYFYICCINLVLTVFQPLYTVARHFAVMIIRKIEVNQVLTPAMVIFLGQVIAVVVLILFIVFLNAQVEPLLTNESLKKQIDIFKLRQIKDDREDKEYKYDLHIIKDLYDGKAIPIKERDRFVQAEVNGASGTGKTSSIFTTAIEEDLNQKLKNREKRKEEYYRLIREGKATIKGPLRIFEENAVVAVGRTKSAREKNEEELQKIRKKYPDAGITVIAPNAALNEDIIKLAMARGETVYVLDPVNNYSRYPNVKMVGMNPFYIPLGLEENERLIHISQAATMFAEVLIATNQRDGKSDQYFTDISLSVCSNIATIIMLAKNIKGQQAYIDDIQECINNFTKLSAYVDVIESHYDIHVEGKDNSKAKILTGDDVRNNERKENSRNARKNPYYLQILFVKQELLGSGAEDMFSQARGLRNLINKVILDQRIKAKLSAEKENMIDFDSLLSDNHITIVNTAIELGSSTSTAFGLFFILLHKISVLRRPMHTRTPHFLWIDEATQYMHPCYEDMIALYRQFMCAVVISLQSLTQTEKSSATAYLKDVFLGAGTHIVFGRLTPDEMELYSKMGGMEIKTEEQVTHTTNSLLSSAPAYSESVRSTSAMSTILEGSQMRLRDFQELTIFTIDNGRVMPGRLARVFFVREEAYKPQEMQEIAWEDLVPEAFAEPAKEEDKPSTQQAEMKTNTADTDKAVTVDTQIHREEAQTLLTHHEKADRIEEKAVYEEMSIGDMMELLYGAGSTADSAKKNPASENNMGQETPEEGDYNYKEELEAFNQR